MFEKMKRIRVRIFRKSADRQATKWKWLLQIYQARHLFDQYRGHEGVANKNKSLSQVRQKYFISIFRRQKRRTDRDVFSVLDVKKS